MPLEQLALLFFVGALASGINTVAGGGSLISFPTLTLGLGMPSIQANATNSVGLWPGSLSGALGYWNLLPKTKHHLNLLVLPTIIGSALGSWLLLQSEERIFDAIVPVLLLAATLLLWFQPQVKALVEKRKGEVSGWSAALLQFAVATYGGYFGAGMGIMMLAVFVLFMKGTIHEINAVKNWLGVLINVVSTLQFVGRGLVAIDAAIALALGSIIGGFLAAKGSQKIDSDKLRMAIAIYGLLTAAYFAYRSWM